MAVSHGALFFCGPAWLLQISTGAFQAQAGSLSCRKQLPPKSIQMKNTVSPPLISQKLTTSRTKSRLLRLPLPLCGAALLCAICRRREEERPLSLEPHCEKGRISEARQQQQQMLLLFPLLGWAQSRSERLRERERLLRRRPSRLSASSFRSPSFSAFSLAARSMSCFSAGVGPRGE